MPNMEIRGKSSMLGLRDELDADPNQPLFILDGFESTLAAINDLCGSDAFRLCCETPYAAPPPRHTLSEGSGLLPVVRFPYDCQRHHCEEHSVCRHHLDIPHSDSRSGIYPVPDAVCRGTVHRSLLRQHRQCRTGTRTEEHRLRHMDILHLPQSAVVGWTGLLHTMAEHNKQR